MDKVLSKLLYFFEFHKASEWIIRVRLFERIGNFITSKLFLWLIGVSFVIFSMDQCFKDNARQAADPSRRNDQYFSGWDGSNPELVDYIKARMNDPKSFEHVETSFHEYDSGDKLRLIMTYRGKNGFGGVVTESVGADFYKPTRALSNINTD